MKKGEATRNRIVVRAAFRPVHVTYLWTCTVQWVACLLLAWWTLRAWRAEDSHGEQYKNLQHR